MRRTWLSSIAAPSRTWPSVARLASDAARPSVVARARNTSTGPIRRLRRTVDTGAGQLPPDDREPGEAAPDLERDRDQDEQPWDRQGEARDLPVEAIERERHAGSQEGITEAGIRTGSAGAHHVEPVDGRAGPGGRRLGRRSRRQLTGSRRRGW